MKIIQVCLIYLLGYIMGTIVTYIAFVPKGKRKFEKDTVIEKLGIRGKKLLTNTKEHATEYVNKLEFKDDTMIVPIEEIRKMALNMRNLTKEEEIACNKGLESISKPTGVNMFDDDNTMILPVEEVRNIIKKTEVGGFRMECMTCKTVMISTEVSEEIGNRIEYLKCPNCNSTAKITLSVHGNHVNKAVWEK